MGIDACGPTSRKRKMRDEEKRCAHSEAQDAAARSTQKQFFGAYLAITIQYLIKRVVRK
jgi:hypothetical protein